MLLQSKCQKRILLFRNSRKVDGLDGTPDKSGVYRLRDDMPNSYGEGHEITFIKPKRKGIRGPAL